MIRVTIELESAVSSARSRRLADIEIANDGSSKDPRRGNYVVTAQRPGGRTRMAGVAGFPRHSRSVLELLRRALNVMADMGELP